MLPEQIEQKNSSSQPGSTLFSSTSKSISLETSTLKNANYLQIANFASTLEAGKTTEKLEDVFKLTNESVIAKPLEPKPTLVNPILTQQHEDAENLDYTEVMIGVSSIITLCLSVLLLTIIFKLIQTYQTPASSPVATSRSNFSVSTNITDLDNIIQLQQIPLAEHCDHSEVNAEQYTKLGSVPSKSKSVMFDLESSYHYQLSASSLKDQILASSGECLGDDKEFRQEMLLTDPPDKWQFPRASSVLSSSKMMENKYLSL